jgi:hypothetical protein
MARGIGGYGRYDSDPDHIGCPRAHSDMTPCIARDGHLALADDGRCVGCNGDAADLLRDLVREMTEPVAVDLGPLEPGTVITPSPGQAVTWSE